MKTYYTIKFTYPNSANVVYYHATKYWPYSSDAAYHFDSMTAAIDVLHDYIRNHKKSTSPIENFVIVENKEQTLKEIHLETLEQFSSNREVNLAVEFLTKIYR
jgi:hypothetical protein